MERLEAPAMVGAGITGPAITVPLLAKAAVNSRTAFSARLLPQTVRWRVLGAQRPPHAWTIAWKVGPATTQIIRTFATAKTRALGAFTRV